VLVAVVAFGATIQSGILAPQFHSVGDAGINGAQFDSVQNTSWRSWTVTSVHFADRRSTQAILDGRTLELSLHQGPLTGDLGPGLASLVVAPGHQFSVRLSNASRVCHYPLSSTSGDVQRYVRSLLSHQLPIPVVITVETPFGTKNISVGPFALQKC
jgi:hypothetical protein